MGSVWRRPLVSLVLLGALLTGCTHHSSGGGATPTSRTGGSEGTTTSTVAPPPSGLHSVSFNSDEDGWALSGEPCPKPGTDPARCATVWRTTDGGRAWVRLAPLDVPAGGSAGPESVSRLRFADTGHGWVFDRSLFATFNGGRRWLPVDLGNPVVDLDTVGGSAYALVATCADGAGGTCSAPIRLAEGTVATGRWRYVSPGFDLPTTDSGSLVVNRSSVYALITGAGVDQLFLARTPAGRWERRTPPCLRAIVEPIAGGDGLVAACRTAAPGAPVELQTSSDGGRTWAVVWQYTFAFPVVSLGVTGQAAVVGLENGDVVRSADSGLSFSPVLHTGTGPAVHFTDADHGTLTAGPPGGRQLFRTTDTGATWSAVPPPH
jgi:photosystem II stability/assembly factor-like uncharacterized protein